MFSLHDWVDEIIIQLYRLPRTRETLNHILEARDKDLLALKKIKYLHDQFRLGLPNKLSFTAISTKMLNCCWKKQWPCEAPLLYVDPSLNFIYMTWWKCSKAMLILHYKYSLHCCIIFVLLFGIGPLHFWTWYTINIRNCSNIDFPRRIVHGLSYLFNKYMCFLWPSSSTWLKLRIAKIERISILWNNRRNRERAQDGPSKCM